MFLATRVRVPRTFSKRNSLYKCARSSKLHNVLVMVICASCGGGHGVPGRLCVMCVIIGGGARSAAADVPYSSSIYGGGGTSGPVIHRCARCAAWYHCSSIIAHQTVSFHHSIILSFHHSIIPSFHIRSFHHYAWCAALRCFVAWCLARSLVTVICLALPQPVTHDVAAQVKFESKN